MTFHVHLAHRDSSIDTEVYSFIPKWFVVCILDFPFFNSFMMDIPII